MAIKLHEEALTYAKHLIHEGKVIEDEKDNWSEDNPSTEEQNTFLEQHGIQEYGKWFLGVDTDENKDTKGRYEFPYGDFTKVHRGGVIAAKVRAGQYSHADIEKAANELLDMIDAGKKS